MLTDGSDKLIEGVVPRGLEHCSLPAVSVGLALTEEFRTKNQRAFIESLAEGGKVTTVCRKIDGSKTSERVRGNSFKALLHAIGIATGLMEQGLQLTR